MIYLDHLLLATNGVLRYAGKQTHFETFSHDTRQLLPGEMFVAVRGEHGNGHDYLHDAVLRGAAGLLVEAETLNALPEVTQTFLEGASVAVVVVADTRLALQQYARAILKRWHPTVIAVTGSVGKTSTKEAIATVLSNHFATFRSWQNYNDLLGLPLSLGRLEERHQYAVLELGCDHPGEIGDLCTIAQPQIGVITNISPTQLQYFGTIERLAEEFGMLFSSLPEDGKAVINADIGRGVQYITPSIKEKQERLHLYKPSLATDIQVSWQGVSGVVNDSSLLPEPPHMLQLASHLLGRHHLSTMLATTLVGSLCGLKFQEIQAALPKLYPLPGRLNPLGGKHSAMLLDDTHNATLASVIAGLATLKELPTGKRLAILGDMLNLGNFEEEAHRLVGRAAARSVDYLIVQGEHASLIGETARKEGPADTKLIVTSTHQDSAHAALQILERHSERPDKHGPPTTVLIKGSEETRMERVTELLMVQPSQAPEVLVRQNPGWKQIVVMRAERPTWVEIDLSAIGNNTRLLSKLVGPQVRILASLKADAYGHGALKVARTVLHNGASMLGVATVSEATPLREAGINAPILVFGYVPPWQMREAVRLGLTITLYARDSAQELSRAALALRQSVKVHVKVDTGMGRLGIRAEDIEEIVMLLKEIRQLPGLELEGIFTHFAVADSLDQIHVRMQLTRFQDVLAVIEAQGLRPSLVHAANSAATLTLPEAHFDMVRPGIALYGLDPSAEVRLPQGFRPALSFKTQVSQVKVISAGEKIGYGGTYITEKPTCIAVLPVGYADGFRRGPTNWGSVLLHGQEAPIIGRVCMDQCMIDISHLPQTRIGDEVVLIGRQGTATLSAEQVAERLGTSNYEVVSAILARVPRVD